MACPQLGVILAYWKQTGVSSPKNPIALAVGVSMGLIKNLDYVEITDGKSTHELTAAEASKALGHDVKEFGTDPSKLENYLKSLYEKYTND